MIDLKIKSKLLLLISSLLLFSSAIISFTSYTLAKSQLNNLGEITLKNATNTIVKEIDDLDEQVKKGILTKKQAQQIAISNILGPKKSDGTRDVIQGINLGKNGYVFIIGTDGTLLAHPSSEGQNIWSTKDPDGNLVGKMIVDSATNGNGLIKYQWPLPGEPNKNEQKIVYSKETKWGWIVSSGSYTSEFNQSASTILNYSLAILLFTLGIGFLIAWIFANRISKPLILVKERLESMAKGDFSGTEIIVETKDETSILANSLNKMSSSLRELLNTVNVASEELTNASKDTATSVQELALASQNITNAITDVSESAKIGKDFTQESIRHLEELYQLVDSAKEKSANSSTNSFTTLSSAQNGSNNVQKLIQQILSIKEKTIHTEEVIKLLETYTKEIKGITDTITEIAKQTQILSLNAHIEAANAGQSGKGFAVVADSIRKLAEETNEGAKQVTSLTAKISEATKLSSASMTENKKFVTDAVAFAEEAGTSLDEILNAVNDTVMDIKSLTELANNEFEVAEKLLETASELQKIMERTTDNAVEVSSSSEETLSSIQSVSSVTEETSSMAGELNNSICKFKL